MREFFAIFSLSFILCLCFPVSTYASASNLTSIASVYKCSHENEKTSYQDKPCSIRENQGVLEIKKNSITTKLRESELIMLKRLHARMLQDAELTTIRDIARTKANAEIKKAKILADAKIKPEKTKKNK